MNTDFNLSQKLDAVHLAPKRKAAALLAAFPLAAPPRTAVRLPAALCEEHDDRDQHDDGDETAATA